MAEQAALLGAALSAAAHLANTERVREFVAALHGLLNSPDGVPLAQSQDHLLRQSVEALSRLGLWAELSLLANRLAETILQGDAPALFRSRLQEVADRDQSRQNDPSNNWTAPFRGLLSVAAGWLDLGLETPAFQVLDQVWELLLKGDLAPWHKMKVAWAYARCLGHVPVQQRHQRVDELFQQLEGVFDTFTTGTYYALAPLLLVESLVLGLTADNCK